MRAIILAAGRGVRLGALGARLPKCLAVVLGGKTLLERQLEVLRSCGIRDICVVRGYRAEAIQEPGVTYVLNPRYAETGSLGSLACAAEQLEGDILVSYSDIWYEPAVVEPLIACAHELAIAVDPQWTDHYLGRTDHPIAEAEQVRFDLQGRAVRIGKIAAGTVEGNGEFIGLMKLSPAGCEMFRRSYHQADRLDGASVADLLQEMIDRGIPIHCEMIRGGWGEIDTAQDYRRAREQWHALKR